MVTDDHYPLLASLAGIDVRTVVLQQEFITDECTHPEARSGSLSATSRLETNAADFEAKTRNPMYSSGGKHAFDAY